MTRPLRLEFAGALYHVTSRGDRGAAIYLDNADRRAWLDTMDLVATRFNFIVHAFCQMTNHYHVLIETAEGNLAQGMRQLNGLYSQYFNRRHRLVASVPRALQGHPGAERKLSAGADALRGAQPPSCRHGWHTR